jgi:hypothetical protein
MLLRYLAAFLNRRSARVRRHRHGGRRPTLEVLEDRCLPSAYTAASVSDLIADINAANQAGGSNTIALAAGTTFTLTAVDNTTDGATGLPVIGANDSLTIDGNGATIQRDPGLGTGTPFRLFDVAAGASLALQNLTLQNGYAFGSGVAAEGGAIYNQGTLTLDGVTVQANTARGDYFGSASYASDAAGGGIWSGGATSSLTLTGGAIIQSNSALGGAGSSVITNPIDDSGRRGVAQSGGDGRGGGLYIAGGSVHLDGATVKLNQALGGNGGWAVGEGTLRTGGGGSGRGGGIDVEGGSVSLTGVTFASNLAQGGRGGSSTDGSSASGSNGGNGLGGGVYVGGGAVTLLGCTVTSNQATGGAGGSGPTKHLTGSPGNGIGGGIYIDNTLASTLVSLDAFTQNHVTLNTASTNNSDIYGRWKRI